ncbi:hypothetical protein [Microbulbifer sp.]|uniref:hypothetical protein n=1 Tax=Microbulbifer sp. TaxID=1908541 RepID=UPI00258F981F|nr:hypothetical protein [Microbulbifer sp.]
MFKKKLKMLPLISALILGLCIGAPSHALVSSCQKTAGTIAHLVTWDGFEKITFDVTGWLTNAEGPNAPTPGVSASSSVPTSTEDPVGHYLINWAPGPWEIIGDSFQFAIISTNPVQVITNPFPGACGESFTLP